MVDSKGTLKLAVLCAVLICVVQGAVVKRDLDTQDLQGPADSEPGCADHPDRIWPDLSEGCKQYFMCKNGKQITQQCDEGLLFDTGFQACILATAATCPSHLTKRGPSHGRPDWLEFSCDHRKDGFYADIARGCHVYYLCVGGKQTKYTCSDDWLFDEEMWACKPPKTYECPRDEEKDPLLTRREKKRLDEILNNLEEILREENLQKA